MDYLYLPNGAYVNNVYDTMSRLTNSFLYSSVPTVLDGHVYQYDRENQRTNEVREADSSTVTYSYDNIGQLTVATSSVPTECRGYTYDTAWNLNYRTNNGSLSTFLVDNKNQLTNSFVARNTYDSNGNMVTNNNNHNVLVYDDENQLTHYFHYQNSPATLSAGDTETDFVYDGLGRLRKRIEWVVSCNSGQLAQGAGVQPNSGGGGNGCTWGKVSETWYIYDGMRVIQERDSNNVPTVSYTRGNDLSVSLEGAGGIGGLLARSSGYSSGNWTSHADYYADGDGNITSLIDGNQSIVASYRYDPFGNIISKSGTLANANVYRFSSKEVHVTSGMYYYGFRFYDPNLQRWINRDPIEEEGGVNLYGFVGNSPLTGIDLFGLDTVSAVTCNTSKGDAGWWEVSRGFHNVLTGIDSNDKLISQLEKHVDRSKEKIDVLNLSGHGYGAGVSYGPGGGFHANTLSDSDAERLKKLLAPNAEIKIWGCQAACDAKGAQALANKLAAKVTGCTENVHSGPNVDPVNDKLTDYFTELMTGEKTPPRWLTYYPQPGVPTTTSGPPVPISKNK